jgi:hypothetical protein
MLKDVETKLSGIEKEFSAFVTSVTEKLNNSQIDFVPDALISLGIYKMRLLGLLQEFENEKAKAILDIDSAARNSTTKITEAKITKVIEADPLYQQIKLDIAKTKGLIDALTSTSIAISTAVKIWGGATVDE